MPARRYRRCKVSTTLFPSLRLGYIVAPAHLVTELARVQAETIGMVPTLEQATLAEFIASGVNLRALSSFGLRAKHNGLVFGFAAIAEEEIESSIVRLRHAWNRLRGYRSF